MVASQAAQAAKNKARQLMWKNWYLSRLARGPDVIWDRKNNPTPWNNVEPGTNTKMMSVNQQFEKQYKRDRL
uniref:NADH dehydrogenase [ubiquinone] 1 alpha subcomplex subunit 4 n=1 Tax=Kalmanozyma brasiliensis (strain GHG001) TaxID=1365824 RepID=V5ETN1_KALBG